MGSLRVLDTERLDMLFGGDKTMVREIYAIAASDFPVTAQRLKEAVEEEDCTAISQYAHTLKGSIANIGGEAASFKAHTINKAALNQKIDTCREILPQFLDSLDEFFEALSDFAEGTH